MSNLSEEEIKKLKCIHLADRRTTDKLCIAIEELKKEKEKVDRLQKENKELKEDNEKQWEERCRLTFKLSELQSEKEGIQEYIKTLDAHAYSDVIQTLEEILYDNSNE